MRIASLAVIALLASGCDGDDASSDAGADASSPDAPAFDAGAGADAASPDSGTLAACPDAVGSIVSGSVTIQSSLDLPALAGVAVITGDLVIDAPGLTEVILPDLGTVGGDVLVISSSALQTLALPGLREVAGRFESQSAPLVDVQLGCLERVGGATFALIGLDATSLALSRFREAPDAWVDIRGAALVDLYLGAIEVVEALEIQGVSLTSVTFPASFATGLLTFRHTPALASVGPVNITTLDTLALLDTGFTDTSAFSGLASLQTLAIMDNAALATVAFPALTTLPDGMYFNRNPLLTTISFPSLTGATPLVEIIDDVALRTVVIPLTSVTDHLEVRNAAALTSLSLSALTSVGGYFYIKQNAALADLSAPLLTTVGSEFVVSNNPALPTCRVLAVLAQLAPPPMIAQTLGNDDAATCP